MHCLVHQEPMRADVLPGVHELMALPVCAQVPTSCGDVGADDVIVLNGTPAEVGDNYLRMLDRRKAAKAKAKATKASAKAAMPSPDVAAESHATGTAPTHKRKARCGHIDTWACGCGCARMSGICEWDV